MDNIYWSCCMCVCGGVRELPCNIYMCVHAWGTVGREEKEQDVEGYGRVRKKYSSSLWIVDNHLFEKEFVWSLICFCALHLLRSELLSVICVGGAATIGRGTIYLVCLGCCYVEVVYDLFWSLLLLCEQEYILNIFVYILGSFGYMYTWVYLGFGLVC